MRDSGHVLAEEVSVSHKKRVSMRRAHDDALTINASAFMLMSVESMRTKKESTTFGL